MPAFFEKEMKFTPILVDGIVLRLEKYFFDLFYAWKKETNNESAGTGTYRILKNISDDLAFRKRTQVTANSYPILPFTNFRWDSVDLDTLGDKYSNFGANQGLYISDFRQVIKFIPSIINFSGATWVSRNDDLFTIRKLIEQERKKRKIKLSLEKYLKINNRPVANCYVFVEFENIEINKYDDVQWLETNKINAVTYNFSVRFMDIFISNEVFPIKDFILTVAIPDEDSPTDTDEALIIDELSAEEIDALIDGVS